MNTQQENVLEKSLKSAATEPAYRPEFIKTLLKSNILVLGTINGGKGEQTLSTGQAVEIKNWTKQDGSPVIPFFSSVETLQNSINFEESYLVMEAKALFELTQGANLVLNPKSPYGKEFFSEEIADMLLSGAAQMPISRTMEAETNVLLGEPNNYPIGMVKSLNILLPKYLNVSRAFLAVMRTTSLNEKPCLVIGIEAVGDSQSVLRDIGNVASATLSEGEVVDLFLISKNEKGLSDYFLTQTKPFYERKRSSKLRAFFGI
jgi:hypothetical protein